MLIKYIQHKYKIKVVPKILILKLMYLIKDCFYIFSSLSFLNSMMNQSERARLFKFGIKLFFTTNYLPKYHERNSFVGTRLCLAQYMYNSNWGIILLQGKAKTIIGIYINFTKYHLQKIPENLT